ncbi:MAG: hypothetical protein CMM56_02655 [Rhodospirillaceae bacterium]|nr:hypothetical protein [Rhodospirillaceae bacterium]|tara:strand:- start:270 stop:545 length:276 start_codon:yes stop_codon:yes gene_type:complete
MLRMVTACFVFLWCCSACSIVEFQLSCLDQDRYLDNGDIGVIQIPDDLDSPDQANALQIPENTVTDQSAFVTNSESCTESPPDFYQEGLPG